MLPIDSDDIVSLYNLRTEDDKFNEVLDSCILKSKNTLDCLIDLLSSKSNKCSAICSKLIDSLRERLLNESKKIQISEEMKRKVFTFLCTVSRKERDFIVELFKLKEASLSLKQAQIEVFINENDFKSLNCFISLFDLKQEENVLRSFIFLISDEIEQKAEKELTAGDKAIKGSKIHLVQNYMHECVAAQKAILKQLNSWLEDEMNNIGQKPGTKSLTARCRTTEKLLDRWSRLYPEAACELTHLEKFKGVSYLSELFYNYYKESKISAASLNDKVGSFFNEPKIVLMAANVLEYEYLDIEKAQKLKKMVFVGAENVECTIWSDEDLSCPGSPVSEQYIELDIKAESICFVDTVDKLKYCKNYILENSQTKPNTGESVLAFDAIFKYCVSAEPELQILQIADRSSIFIIDYVHAQSEEQIFHLKKLISAVLTSENLIVGYNLRQTFRLLHQLLNEEVPLWPTKFIDFCISTKGWKHDGCYVKEFFNNLFSFDVEEMKKSNPDKKFRGGLNKLCYYFFDKAIDERDRVSNWGRRPLREQQLMYACSKVYIFIMLYDKNNQLYKSTDKFLKENIPFCVLWKKTTDEWVNNIRIKNELKRKKVAFSKSDVVTFEAHFNQSYSEDQNFAEFLAQHLSKPSEYFSAFSASDRSFVKDSLMNGEVKFELDKNISETCFKFLPWYKLEISKFFVEVFKLKDCKALIEKNITNFINHSNSSKQKDLLKNKYSNLNRFVILFDIQNSPVVKKEFLSLLTSVLNLNKCDSFQYQYKISLIETFMTNSFDAQEDFVEVFENWLKTNLECVHSSVSLEKFQILSKTLNRWVNMFDNNGAYVTLINQTDAVKEIDTLLDRFYNKSLISGEALSECILGYLQNDDYVFKFFICLLKYQFDDVETADQLLDAVDRKDKTITKNIWCNKDISDLNNCLELKIPQSNLISVDTLKGLESCLQELLNSPKKDEILPIGLDAEWHCGKMGLLQLATDCHVYLIDVLYFTENNYLENFVHFINTLFSSQNLILLGFSLKDDFNMLGKCLGGKLSTPKNFLDFLHAKDTELMMSLERIISPASTKQRNVKGLSKLVLKILGVKLDKREQISNWSNRPLRNKQIIYAAIDAHCLILLYNKYRTTYYSKDYVETFETKLCQQGVLNTY